MDSIDCSKKAEMGRKPIKRYRYKDPKVKEKHAIRFMIYFQEHGVEKFSMSKMAADLKMSKTTIYNHFETKEEAIEAALDYKLSIIKDYQTVLENITLPYTERYRKSMLFFCVQTFDISNKLLFQLESSYPKIYKKVESFQRKVFVNLKSYYEVGIDIGVFKEDVNPLLLALDDQKFFEMLSERDLLKDHNIEVLDAFAHHFKMKFRGILK
ncbi:MAG: TetR/AcrR family transcriptional regulator [Flavobacteriales bacterium]|nr:TetR/AcrR family transcriptional regulator [Flavobacteriales bacterium]